MMYFDYVGNSAAFLADVRRRQSALLYQYSVAEVVQVARALALVAARRLGAH